MKKKIARNFLLVAGRRGAGGTRICTHKVSSETVVLAVSYIASFLLTVTFVAAEMWR